MGVGYKYGMNRVTWMINEWEAAPSSPYFNMGGMVQCR